MQLLSLVIGAVIGLAAPGGEPSRVKLVHPTHRALVKADRRVRTMDSRVSAALFSGVTRSRTFASLIDTLDRSDVIVYIELQHELPRAIDGRLLLASRAGGLRYVRIQLHSRLGQDHMIAVLGHELQHAIKIAEAPEIRDEASLRRYYQRAGAGMSDGVGYDTQAARIAGDTVKRELRSGPA